ncbi:hypothetical protein RE428_27450 [Marinobacter nanhaiticus D15-8W]|uniref:CDP-alcohol phosphatidyltransferase family protein n=1 Tax=Marinobacter nanhaiticus D15-8W TaxID=626887 RepID=N6W2J6_9GAMM|nr:CDP-alcohol phosphatidyltransferase family protein [Marinobacter nanhaiticus]ENO14339.1 CDP-alcohol phosphatidyltransferase family protein [Marinobacter nanhaiticus D15-8W]BES71727.1 hypothetical protein RE428_27450 [Marinobacter nanhaiticus D15-8W]
MDISRPAGLPAKIASELAVAAGLTITAAALLSFTLHLAVPFVAFTTLLGLGLTAAVGVFWALSPPTHRPQDADSLGLANQVTLGRGVLICVVAGFIPFNEYAQTHAWTVASITLIALILDGVDGAAARRTRSHSAFGARFDMELDALLILILCGLTIVMDKAGAWVLLIGLYRYIFVVMGRLYPKLTQPLPESFRRKTICVWQLVTLMICLLPLITPSMATGLLALALALLTYSFMKDIVWLIRQPKR